ncbi:Hsp20/alpha crystallin family protein [Candidatus Microgenomates bacterium]|jgi:HSP20 family protein|nr:MAG: Hsp20/alpha crystallin family protein [Candidatus Microgenomates bacterium]
MAIVRWEPSGLTRRILDWPFLFSDEEMPMAIRQGLDIYETENEVVVKAPVPGVLEDEVDVTFENGVLRIQARHEETDKEKEEKRTVYQQQRIVSFDYTTTLPRSVDPDKISAEVENGVVVVKAPIAEEAKPRKIAIKGRR